jgi:nicotinate dehydrogenase subunit B
MAKLHVNGRFHEVSLDRKRRLLHVLREELGYTGPKYGCGEGECGTCTVLADGEPIHACMVDVGEVAAKAITTIEGLAAGGRLHPLQRGFAEAGAFQCGYCTPGMIVTASALLAKTPDPTDEQIKSSMNGNICRCGTYPRILRAIHRAAEIARTGDAVPPIPISPPAEILARAVPWDRLDPKDRDYFSALGDGIVAVVPQAATSFGLPKGGAWIHAGASGAITAFTGKVEVGQGTRTGLTVIVAEELRVAVGQVRLIMGDTDVTPWDVGTFASRATPDAGEDLRRAAAVLREAILGIAAKRWAVARTTLAAAEGRVREQTGSRSEDYGKLLQGTRLIESVPENAPVTPATAWQTAGLPTPNPRAGEVVTAAKKFPTDVAVPGMLFGNVLRPPAFGATLRSADISRARAIAGVTVVQDGNFVGAIAESTLDAREAIAAVSADWAFKPQPSEARLVEHLRSHPTDTMGWEGPVHQVNGDVDHALASASVQLRETYTTAYIAHVPVEPRCAIAEWKGERLTVWTGTQVPFGVREELAEAFSIPEERVRVVMPDAGTGFGGKHAGVVAIEAARLAKAAERPVKVLWSREEEFTWGYFRPAAVIDVRAGVDGAGVLTAWEFRNFNAGSAALMTPYDVRNKSIHFQPTAAPLAQGAYRSLAAAANHFARECAMDELAHAARIDPLEFRLRNLRDERIAAVFRKAAERAGWANREQGNGTAWGLAGGIEKGSRVATCAQIRIDAGQIRVLRVVTAFECGAVYNPDAVQNQIEGATVMGLGGALFEAIHFDEGRIHNPRLSQYRVPRFHDLPEIEVVLLDRKDQPSAGAGETPIVGVAPAIANALFEATGRRVRSLPLQPGVS